ncbi:hypothetical protein BLA29_009860, partial [Euroglyphus maynei]
MGSICSRLSPVTIDDGKDGTPATVISAHTINYSYQRSSTSSRSAKKRETIHKTMMIPQSSIQLTSCPRLPCPKSVMPTIRIDKRKIVQTLEQEDVFRRV